MRLVSASLCWCFGVFVLAVPAAAWSQQVGPSPSTTQSQSGYPDVRREASDPTLFPNPDKVASDRVRPLSGNDAANVGLGTKGQGKRGGAGRVTSQSLGQADTDPLPVRVAYRRAKTLAMERNPNLGTLLERATRATSDVEKRRCLREYYAQLFAEVRRIDTSPAMKSHLAALQASTEQRYDPKRRAVAGEEDLINGRLFTLPGLTR